MLGEVSWRVCGTPRTLFKNVNETNTHISRMFVYAVYVEWRRNEGGKVEIGI